MDATNLVHQLFVSDLEPHKVQGCTLDKAYIDMGQRVFAQGMTYVALSRLRTIEGLSLLRPLRKNDIIRDEEVINFYRMNGGI